MHCTLNPNSCKCIIRPCLTAAILSRETKKALFYHAKPHPHGFHCEAWRGKTKLFWSPGTIWPPCDKGECAAEKKANGYCNYDWYKHQLTQFVQENVLFSCTILLQISDVNFEETTFKTAFLKVKEPIVIS